MMNEAGKVHAIKSDTHLLSVHHISRYDVFVRNTFSIRIWVPVSLWCFSELRVPQIGKKRNSLGWIINQLGRTIRIFIRL